MSKIKYAAAMLAAGGAAGAAASAQALTIITATLDLPADQPPVYITLDGSGATVSLFGPTANYAYGQFTDKTILLSDPGLGLIGEVTTTPGLPSPGETYAVGGYKATDSLGAGPGVTDYVHLEFFTSGTEYIGTAEFDAAGDLESIMYEAAPEPEAWALLIAGMGLAGGALRGARRRRQRLAA
jgi:hypothetical protein